MPTVVSARSYSKSIKTTVLHAFHIGKTALPSYFHPKSRHDFTPAQLFALLVLRAQLKTDFRGLVEFLKDFPDVLRWLELRRVPHYSTLCRTGQRIGKHFGALLDATLVQACTRGLLQETTAGCD
jgi:hypothetical protein